MLTRIGSFIEKDITNGLRDNMIIYMMVFPLVLAVAFRLFMPTLQGAKATFAVNRNTGPQFIEKLENYGNVIVLNDYEALVERVERTDDAIGITKVDGRYTVLAEGNEIGGLEEIAGAIIDTITQKEPIAEFKRLSLGRTSSQAKETAASMLILSSIIIGGLLIGLNMVEEKENKAIQGIAVSPMTMFEYIGARAIGALAVAMVLSIASSIILIGFNADYTRIIIGILLSVLFSIIVGLVMGGLSNDQMSAIAIMKVSMLFIVWIPLGSLFVPKAYQWVFYIFPHYWVFQIFQNVYTGSSLALGYWESCLATVLTSIVFMIILWPVLRKKLKLR